MHWQTVVTRLYDTTERRVALASRPFEELVHSYQLSDDEARYLRADLARAPAARRHVVMPIHQMTVTVSAPIGATVVTVGTTTLSDCLEPGRGVLLINKPTRAFHYAEVVSTTSSTITLSQATVIEFPMMASVIVPLAICTVAHPVQFSRHPEGLTIAAIRARSYYVDASMGAGAAALTTYDGKVVLDFRVPAQSGTAPEETNAEVDFIGYGGPQESYFADPGDGAQGVNQREVQLTIPDPATRQRLRLFLATVVGRQKAFLLPTYRPDLAVAIQPTIDEMVVHGNYYSGVTDLLGRATYERLMLTFEGGSTGYWTVIGAVDNGNGTETLLLNADVDTGVLGDVVKVSFLELVRLGTDEVPWVLAGGSGTLVTFPVVSCLE